MPSAHTEPSGSGAEPFDPAHRLLGGPPLWATLPDERRRPIGLDTVLAALKAAGQLGPAPDGPPAPPGDSLAPWRRLLPAGASTDDASAAAVLVALFEEGGEARVVLTRRSAELRTHRGQVSFPGGRLDEGEDASGAALREAREEIGLDPGAVRVVAWLHPLFTLNATSFVLPVVGVLGERPSLVANPDEVARVFDVALADLVDEGAFREETWDPYEAFSTAGPQARRIWFFDVADERVWGATARILHELALLTLGIPIGD
jgi:8-oxo-dGTP pyrophosphatase MutT (NUDIX family)